MAKSSVHRPAHSGVFVSSFVTNRVMEERTEDVELFDLEGVGHGHWDTEGNAIDIIGTLFLLVTFINPRPGTHEVRAEIQFQDGTQTLLNRYVAEISDQFYSLSYCVPLTGITLPIGMHYVWVYVDGEPKAAAFLRVFGPDDPPAT